MNRRSFLRTLAAVALAPVLPKPAPPALGFSRRAFASAFVGDTVRVRVPQRYDVLYGWGAVQPAFGGIRIVEETTQDG